MDELANITQAQKDIDNMSASLDTMFELASEERSKNEAESLLNNL